MSLFQNLLKRKDVPAKKLYVRAPMEGKLKSLSDLGDGVFSEMLLGEGRAIVSEKESLTAPFDGKVTMTTDSGHAIGLLSDEGAEVLLHVGLDTVMMNGEGFRVYVKKGDRIHTGQRILSFSRKKIRDGGFADDVLVIVTNTDDFQKVEAAEGDEIKEGENLFVLER